VLTTVVTRLGGRAVGLVAGLAAATNPLLLAWVVEARSYGLAVLTTALAALGLARWQHRPAPMQIHPDNLRSCVRSAHRGLLESMA